MSVVLILQARMGSSRLPGKSMMPLAGVPLVGRILERVKRARRPDGIVLATTELPADDCLVDLANSFRVDVFRGSENDLLDRYVKAAEKFGANYVARLPADNFAPEPEEIDRIIDFALDAQTAFATNLSPIMNNGYPDGIGCEVYRFTDLCAVSNEVTEPSCREHPHTNYFDFKNDQPIDPLRYPVGTVQCPQKFSRPDICLDVNTAEDLEFAQTLYSALYPSNPNFHILDVIDWYDTQWLPSQSRKRIAKDNA